MTKMLQLQKKFQLYKVNKTRLTLGIIFLLIAFIGGYFIASKIMVTKDFKAQASPKAILKESPTPKAITEETPVVAAKSIKEYPVDGIPVENAIKTDGKKYAFLTFDDGPSPRVTDKVLAILNKNNIHATFFLVGKLAETHPSTVEKIYKQGHAIGNHTYSHVYKKVYSNEENFTSEFMKTDQILKKILGPDFHTRLFRFPGGSFESNKQKYKAVLKKNGYTYIDWNALTGDAESRKRKTHDELMARLKHTVGKQEDVIILMHDFGAMEKTIGTVDDVIQYLKKQGYEFKTLK
jgi:peptidoglycan/xylan/chitin deacetylase (PgdA/CDA1 family)